MPAGVSAVKQLNVTLKEYREKGWLVREPRSVQERRRLLSLAKLAAIVIQGTYRTWIHRRRKLAKLQAQRSIERELGASFEDTFSVVLRNVNNCAAIHDDGLRKSRQKQQRKGYLLNVLKSAVSSGDLRHLAQPRPASRAVEALTDRSEVGGDAGAAHTLVKSKSAVPGVLRAALQLQLEQRKLAVQIETAAVSSRVLNPASYESPGQVLFEILAKVSHDQHTFPPPPTRK
jgi:hypothetical protein